MRTNQEIFDIVAKHLLAQMERSRNREAFFSSACAYHSSDGLKCAIGCLIPDSLYQRSLEHRRADDPVIMKAADLLPSQITLALQLQRLHDELSPEYWRAQLEVIGDFFRLSTAVLQQSSSLESKLNRRHELADIFS